MIDWYGVLTCLVWAIAMICFSIPWVAVGIHVFNHHWPEMHLPPPKSVKRIVKVQVRSDLLLEGEHEKVVEEIQQTLEEERCEKHEDVDSSK